jgi:hypothetical protein
MEDPVMNEPKNEYALAGWLAIAAAVLILPTFVLSFATEIAKHRAPGLVLVFLVAYIAITICYTLCGIYVILRFRTYLNQKHGFHAIDGLITAVVAGVIAITLYVVPMKALTSFGYFDEPPLALLIIVPMAVIAVTLGILGIVIGARLLGMPAQSTSYFKIYAWLSIAAGICFATFILGPLGGLIDAAANIVLAMLFLNPDVDEVAPEFV